MSNILKDFCDNDGKYGIPAPAIEYNSNKYRYLRISDISDDGFLLDIDKKSVDDVSASNYLLKDGDLVIARTGNSTGRTFLYEPKYGELVYAGFLIRYHINKSKINPKFIKYYTISNTYKQWVNNYQDGSTRGNMNAQSFAKMPIPEINRNQQNNIVGLLDTITNKIELNNKIKENLEKYTKTLYDYWFVQFDFPDENNKPYKSSGGAMVYNEVLKREIPVGWDVKELQNITSISNEQITPNEGVVYRHYSIPAFDEKGTYVIDLGKDIHSSKFVVHPCDLLISKLNPRFNRVICADDEKNMISSTELIVFKCNNKQNQALMYCIAKSDNFYSYCTKNATGSSGSHNRINPEIMGAFKIPFNNIIFEQFKSKINNIIQKRNLIIRENTQLSQLRDWLLPMLMNGQITVLDSNEDDLSEDKIIEKSLEFWQTHGKMDIDQFARENGILVYKDNEQKKGAVSYNAEKDLCEIAVKDPRDNFTIAHEIGHILKHKKELKNGTLGRKSEESGSKIMEYEADSLAAEILMPEEYVLQYMQNENKTDKEFLDEKFIKECAKHFDVNPPAMNIRLKNLGFKVPYLK